MKGFNKVLIVDDVEVNRIILREILKEDYEVIEAKNGMEAYKIICENYEEISLLILDIVMPILGGFDLLKLLQANSIYNNIIKVVITGADDSESRRKAIKFGASDLIIKPFDTQIIKTRIKDLMNKKEFENIIEENITLKKCLSIKNDFNKFIDGLPVGIASVEIDLSKNIIKNILYANSYFCDVLQIEYNDFGKMKFSEEVLINRKDIKGVIGSLVAKREVGLKNEYRISYKKKNGSVIWLYTKVRLVSINENIYLYDVVFYEISSIVDYEKTLVEKIELDSVTRSYNKETFYKKARQLIIDNMNKKFAIVVLNIEKFETINKIYGFQEGNQLLQDVVKNIEFSFKDNFYVFGRISSDKFALCIERKYNYIDKLVELSKQMFTSYKLDVAVIAKFGVYEVHNNAVPVFNMCDNALLALKSINGNVSKVYEFFQEDSVEKYINKQQIINDMYYALKNQQFLVYYQPIIDLTTKEIVCAESSVKWNHPDKGLISPIGFIETFEKSGFITSMDELVWTNVCKQIKDWIKCGIENKPIVVSISNGDLYNPFMTVLLEEVISKYNIPKELIVFNISQRAYIESAEQFIRITDDLINMGYDIIIDNYGIGCSTLDILNRVKVRSIKFSMNFLMDAIKFVDAYSILVSIVKLAKSLNLKVIAKDISTKEQANFIERLGFDMGQGSYYSKELTSSNFEKLLSNK